LAARPVSLSGGGFVLYALGGALARERGPLDLRAYAVGQAFITATQLMTHYCNDYFDQAADAANLARTTWSGGSGVLQEGILEPRTARAAAIALGAVALLLAVLGGVVCMPTAGTTVLVAIALVLSWEYSAPPLRLHARGMGPATAAIVVGGLTPLVGFGMQGFPWTRSVFATVVPLVLAQFALNLVLDFPDADADAGAGKHTMVVLIGHLRARALAVCVVAAVYASLPGLASAGAAAHLVVAVWATAPLGAWLTATLMRGAGRAGGPTSQLTWAGVLWFASIAIAELIATGLDALGSGPL